MGSQPVPCSRMYCSAHRLADRLRQHGGVHGAVVGVVAAIGAGAGHPLTTCTFSSGRSSIAASPAWTKCDFWRAGEAGHVAVLDLDQRAGRSHGGMGLDTAIRTRPRSPCRRLEGVIDVADVLLDRALAHRRLADHVIERRLGRERRLALATIPP